MKRQDFYYDLPKELIAQDPLAERSSSRLLALNRTEGTIRHRVFTQITDYLEPGDCLVINDTKVIPARLFGEKLHEDTPARKNANAAPEETEEAEAPHGARIEVLLLKRLSDSRWETLVKPGKKARIGTKLRFGDNLMTGTVVDIVEEGNRIIEFEYDGIFEEILDQLGSMPLPPYITHELQDKNRYQTVYAVNTGSAAAPTAGLHFTQDLLRQIEAKGVVIARVTLNVGLGTFRPVKEDDILQHHMHSELYEILPEAAEKINAAKAAGKRVICVGTTSCRTLEAAAEENGHITPQRKETGIFIYPGYRFKVTDALITNFHLPESTLLMLVSALASRDIIMEAYREAVNEKYRFFSFGDAMYIGDNVQ